MRAPFSGFSAPNSSRHRHQARHFGLGDVDFLAAPVGKRNIGDVVVLGHCHAPHPVIEDRRAWPGQGGGVANVRRTSRSPGNRQWDIKKSLSCMSFAGQASSPKRVPTSSSSAAMAFRPRGRWRVTRIVQPGLAASIIRPMIEVPPTVVPSFSTGSRHRSRSAIWTNLAEARACRPRWLMIRRSRAMTGRRPSRAEPAHLPLSSWLATLMYLRPASCACSQRVRHVVCPCARWPA